MRKVTLRYESCLLYGNARLRLTIYVVLFCYLCKCNSILMLLLACVHVIWGVI